MEPEVKRAPDVWRATWLVLDIFWKFCSCCHLPIAFQLAENILWWASLAFGTKSEKLFSNPHHHSSSTLLSATWENPRLFSPFFAPTYVLTNTLSNTQVLVTRLKLTFYDFLLFSKFKQNTLWILKFHVGYFLTGLSVFTIVPLLCLASFSPYSPLK